MLSTVHSSEIRTTTFNDPSVTVESCQGGLALKRQQLEKGVLLLKDFEPVLHELPTHSEIENRLVIQ